MKIINELRDVLKEEKPRRNDMSLEEQLKLSIRMIEEFSAKEKEKIAPNNLLKELLCQRNES